MELEWEYFSEIHSLIDYVNKYDIKRENIQEIIRTSYNSFILLYWKKK